MTTTREVRFEDVGDKTEFSSQKPRNKPASARLIMESYNIECLDACTNLGRLRKMVTKWKRSSGE